MTRERKREKIIMKNPPCFIIAFKVTYIYFKIYAIICYKNILRNCSSLFDV